AVPATSFSGAPASEPGSLRRLGHDVDDVRAVVLRAVVGAAAAVVGRAGVDRGCATGGERREVAGGGGGRRPWGVVRRRPIVARPVVGRAPRGPPGDARVAHGRERPADQRQDLAGGQQGGQTQRCGGKPTNLSRTIHGHTSYRACLAALAAPTKSMRSLPGGGLKTNISGVTCGDRFHARNSTWNSGVPTTFLLTMT